MLGDDREGAASPTPAQGVKVTELSRYVAEMCSDLAVMASSANLLMLTYLLSMARQEAERISRSGSAPGQPAASKLC